MYTDCSAITRDSKFRKYGFDPFRIRDTGGRGKRQDNKKN